MEFVAELRATPYHPMKTAKRPASTEPADKHWKANDLVGEIRSHCDEAESLLEEGHDAQHNLDCIYDLVDDLKKLFPTKMVAKPAKKKR